MFPFNHPFFIYSVWVDISEWVENALLQTWHSKSLFFSWTADTWRFRLENVVKLEGHKLQLNGFLPSWTDWICFRKLLSLAHFLSQIEHSNFFPSWTVLMCLFKVPFSEKADLQSLHECDFLPSWTVFTCLNILSFIENVLVKHGGQPHVPHLAALSIWKLCMHPAKIRLLREIGHGLTILGGKN